VATVVSAMGVDEPVLDGPIAGTGVPPSGEIVPAEELTPDRHGRTEQGSDEGKIIIV
jgi:hypothetical protein